MISLASVKTYLGVTGTAQDAVLEVLRKGTLELVAGYARYSVDAPPVVRTEVLDVTPFRSGGLSGIDGSQEQEFFLLEQPNQVLSGTVTVTAGSAAVAGTGTRFLTELLVGSALEIGAETALVSAIASNTALTLTTPHVAGATAAAAKSALVSVETREDLLSAWELADPRDFELQGARLISKKCDVPAGSGRIRLRYRVGFQEDQGPAEASMVAHRIIQSYFEQRDAGTIQSASLGTLSVTYANLSPALRMDLEDLRKHRLRRAA